MRRECGRYWGKNKRRKTWFRVDWFVCFTGMTSRPICFGQRRSKGYLVRFHPSNSFGLSTKLDESKSARSTYAGDSVASPRKEPEQVVRYCLSLLDRADWTVALFSFVSITGTDRLRAYPPSQRSQFTQDRYRLPWNPTRIFPADQSNVLWSQAVLHYVCADLRHKRSSSVIAHL